MESVYKKLYLYKKPKYAKEDYNNTSFYENNFLYTECSNNETEDYSNSLTKQKMFNPQNSLAYNLHLLKSIRNSSHFDSKVEQQNRNFYNVSTNTRLQMIDERMRKLENKNENLILMNEFFFNHFPIALNKSVPIPSHQPKPKQKIFKREEDKKELKREIKLKKELMNIKTNLQLYINEFDKNLEQNEKKFQSKINRFEKDMNNMMSNSNKINKKGMKYIVDELTKTRNNINTQLSVFNKVYTYDNKQLEELYTYRKDYKGEKIKNKK